MNSPSSEVPLRGFSSWGHLIEVLTRLDGHNCWPIFFALAFLQALGSQEAPGRISCKTWNGTPQP